MAVPLKLNACCAHFFPGVSREFLVPRDGDFSVDRPRPASRGFRMLAEMMKFGSMRCHSRPQTIATAMRS
jgi:hypothetical protein